MTSMPRQLLATAIQLAGLFGVAAPALAQADGAASTQLPMLDAVQVTGTRLRKAEMETAVPVQVITREQITSRGFTSTADVLQTLTASGSGLNGRLNASGNSGFPPDGGGVGAGAATVDLRHLGAKRVLVLVDGLRWVNESSGSGVGAAVDLNTIPLALIDRIEVLEDGASSIYGSDAIAGVVNIITRREAQGGSLDFHHGEYGGLGGATSGVDLTWGGQSARSQWLLGASYFRQQEIASDRFANAAVPVPGTGTEHGSSATPSGRFVFRDPNTGLVHDLAPDTSGRTPAYLPGIDGCDRSDGFHCFDAADRYNYAPDNLLLTPSERSSVFAQLRTEMTPRLSAYVRALYNTRTSANQAAPEPILLGADAGVHNPWAESALTISARNPFNPFGFDLTTAGPDPDLFLLARRPVEGGRRRFEQDVKSWYLSAGLEGTLPAGIRTWNWDVNLVRSQSRAQQTNTGSYNIRRINEALGDPDVCAAIAGCVPLDLFGGPGSITADMLAFIQPVLHDRSRNGLTVASANLTGDLFRLWSDTLSFAAGFEYRSQEGSYLPDPVTRAGEYNGVPSGATRGGYDVREAYLEFGVPLMRDGAFGEMLDLDIAGRYSRYSSFGGETNAKLGLRWQPVDEIVLRMSYAQGFRAPSIGELYGTLSRFDASLVDPCSGPAAVSPACVANGVPPGYEQANPQIPVTTSGNPDLRPEHSRSLMLGAVWSPSLADDVWWSDRLDLGVTFYRHHIDDAIQAPDAQAVLDRCVGLGDAEACAAFTRSERGQIIRFDDRLANLGSIRTDGWDFSAAWTLPEREWGRLRFDARASWVGRYELVNERGVHEPRRPGVEANDSAIPEWTAALVSDWSMGPWSLAWTMRHIDQLVESCGAAAGYRVCDDSVRDRHRLGAVTYHDLQLDWRNTAWLEGTRLTLGVRNLTGKTPPVCLSCSLNGYDASTYELPGRFVYARLGFDF